MLKRLLTYLKEGNSYNAIELYSDGEKDMTLISSFVNTKNGLEREIYGQEEKAEFNVAMIPKKRAFLVINTNNVITKIERASRVNEVALVQKVFPNLKLEDFFYEITSYENSQFISICRKSYVIECLEFFKQKGITITGFSIGISNITILIPFINTESFSLNSKEIVATEDGVEEIHSGNNNSEQQHNVQGMLLTAKELLGFANILTYIKNSHGEKSNFASINLALKEEGIHSHLFNVFLKSGIVLILISLLINFLFFNHYYTRTESLRQIQQVNKANKSKIMELTKIVKDKEKLIDDVISSSSSEVSYFLDALTYELPKAILLSIVDYQPLGKQIKENKEIQIRENELIVSGISADSKVFSSWIETLETYNWIEKVGITAYDYSQKEASEFSLIITIEDEK